MTAQPLPEMSTGALEVRREGPVAWVVLDRPDRRNALSPAMWAALPGVLEKLDADPGVRVIGLRGAGGVFSAGADIREVFDCLAEPQTGLPRGGALSDAEAALKTVHKPTIAALEGYCMGGAWMLAGACDFRIATSSLRIGLTPARIGIIYPATGIENLVELIGPGAASYLLMTGDTIDAAQAERWGMLTKVFDDADFEHELQRVVEGLSKRSQFTVQAHKHLVARSLDRSKKRGAVGGGAISEALFREVLDGPDAKIGQRAFMAKQPPAFQWTGEEFWARFANAANTGKGHFVSAIRGRWPRRSAGQTHS